MDGLHAEKSEDINPNFLEVASETNGCFSNFTLLEISEVESLVCKSATKSCELDYIPTYLLKEHLDIFLPVLQCIINTSLQQGMFPHCLRTALVRPLLKKSWLGFSGEKF